MRWRQKQQHAFQHGVWGRRRRPTDVVCDAHDGVRGHVARAKDNRGTATRRGVQEPEFRVPLSIYTGRLYRGSGLPHHTRCTAPRTPHCDVKDTPRKEWREALVALPECDTRSGAVCQDVDKGRRRSRRVRPLTTHREKLPDNEECQLPMPAARFNDVDWCSGIAPCDGVPVRPPRDSC